MLAGSNHLFQVGVWSRLGLRKLAQYLVDAWTPGHCQPRLCLHAWPGLSGEWGRSCYSGLMLISPDSLLLRLASRRQGGEGPDLKTHLPRPLPDLGKPEAVNTL